MNLETGKIFRGHHLLPLSSSQKTSEVFGRVVKEVFVEHDQYYFVEAKKYMTDVNPPLFKFLEAMGELRIKLGMNPASDYHYLVGTVFVHDSYSAAGISRGTRFDVFPSDANRYLKALLGIPEDEVKRVSDPDISRQIFDHPLSDRLIRTVKSNTTSVIAKTTGTDSAVKNALRDAASLFTHENFEAFELGVIDAYGVLAVREKRRSTT